MNQLMRMEKRGNDDNKELLDLLKVKNKKEDSKEGNEDVGKEINGKGTTDEIQQV
jgi:hypothetical protein